MAIDPVKLPVIAVTGASGWVGRAVSSWLEQQGHPVRRLVRRPAGPTEQTFDLTEQDWARRWPQILSDCVAVVHCAAHVHRPVETDTECKAFAEVNERATDRLLQACHTAGVRRFVLASTVAVYDWSEPGRIAREDHPLAPSTAYGQSKLAAEAHVRRWRGDWCIARLATIYGENDCANFARLAAALRRRRFVLPPTATARKSVLPLQQAAACLGRLSLLSSPPNLTVNLAAPSAPSLGEICEAFCAVCGFPTPWRLPPGGLQFIAKLGDATTAIGGRFPLTSDVLKKLTTATVVDVARMQELFPEMGWETFAQALKRSANYYAKL
jgi:nucleoside-diphosphate-sugar epimerase